MNSIIKQVQRIKNISEFATKSGVPRRTLVRIKELGESHAIRPTTRLALESAIKKHKPAMEDSIESEASNQTKGASK